MTDDDIHNLDPYPYVMRRTHRIDFARAIEAQVREECAKVADEESTDYYIGDTDWLAAKSIAERIRSTGK